VAAALKRIAAGRHRTDRTGQLRPIESRSGAASVGDQLILMSTISPRGRCKAPISPGSSPAAEAECGHHAASMSPSRTRARVIRAGRAQRRAPVEPFTIVALQRRQRRRRVDPKTSDIRLVFRRLRPKRHIPARRDGKTGSSCPCGVLTNEEVDRYALLTEGRRSNRTLISFIMRLRFAMTARTRLALDCTGSGHGRLHRPISGSGAYKIVVLLC